MIRYSLYEVGGRVRDKFLGLPSNDVDYSVVIENNAAWGEDPDIDIVFSLFVKQLELEGYRIYLVTPDCFTIRAKFPTNHVHSGLDADFVLARKEHGYIRGTRKPKVSLGTLIDDLIRRDFTVNAMAEDVLGNILDPFGGQQDLLDKVLRTPTDAVISFNDDPLRILRAFRFSITKGFGLSLAITDAIKLFDVEKMDVVSTDRIRYELEKMFKHDTKLTLSWLNWLSTANHSLLNNILRDDLWFMPTTRS